MELQHREITVAIIGAAFEVYGVLGYGFLECVYKRAMQVELQARGFKADIESDIRVCLNACITLLASPSDRLPFLTPSTKRYPAFGLASGAFRSNHASTTPDQTRAIFHAHDTLRTY